MSFLETILADKRREVEARRGFSPLERLQAQARRASPPRGLGAALGRESRSPRIIAEVKKASPSKGVIRAEFDPLAIALSYEGSGAAAISVLTDEPHFQGRIEHLEAIRRAVRVPVLRKDFLIDPYQVWEARAAGADAILLILAALEDDEVLKGLADLAAELGMDVLWEVHGSDELRRLLSLEPHIVGINNRNLRTFEVNLETTRALMEEIPEGVVTVSESGFTRREEIDRMRGWGVDAFLIGESLLRAPDPGAALAELLRPAGGASPWT